MVGYSKQQPQLWCGGITAVWCPECWASRPASRHASASPAWPFPLPHLPSLFFFGPFLGLPWFDSGSFQNVRPRTKLQFFVCLFRKLTKPKLQYNRCQGKLPTSQCRLHEKSWKKLTSSAYLLSVGPWYYKSQIQDREYFTNEERKAQESLRTLPVVTQQVKWQNQELDFCLGDSKNLSI